MTYKQIVDRLTANVQAAIKTDETRFGREFVVSHINSARASAIQQFWQRNKRINPQWLQDFDLEYSNDLQADVANNCITKYYVPSWISLDGKTDGMVFVGNAANKNFRIFNTRSELAAYLNIPKQSPYSGRFVGVLREGGMIELHYSNKIKSGRILMLYNNPLDCPSYNIDSDPYPVTEDLVIQIEDVLIKKLMSMAQQPMDVVPTKNDIRVGQIQPYRAQS